jgi:hypothetical protein
MGLSTTFHLIYGFRLSSELKDKNGRKFSPFDEDFEPYLEGQQHVQPFTLIWDQMGSWDKMFFGQSLVFMYDDHSDSKEVDITPMREKVKELYLDLFKDHDVPRDVEPKVWAIAMRN